ncbi:MAG: hypothetical protein K0R58_5 [Ramlibacter sp.]|jgi:lambda family phage portal protein|nr:hypothetical protein [Ramlibacter sp.]
MSDDTNVRHRLVQQNVLDKVITYFSPKAGARRLAARGALALAGGYTGARIDRSSLKNWKPGGGSPETDIIADLPMLRDRTRDAVRNAPVATGAVGNAVSAIVGTGLSCNPGINHAVLGVTEEYAAEWNSDTRQRFEAWAESMDVDLSERQDFYGEQDLSLRSAFESGDSWVLTPLVDRPGKGRELALQVIEADRVCNPNHRPNSDTMQDGVELDPETLKTVAIHVAQRHPGDLRSGNSWTRVEVRGAETGRRNVLQIWKQIRPAQVRGVPWLAPILEPLKQLTRWTDNELAAAVTSSLFTLFVKMDPDAFEQLFEDDAQNALVERTQKWSGDLENSKAVNLLPGEEVQTAAMDRPNPAFDPFWIAMVRQIGMAIQVPYEVLVMHFQSSYSAARGALLMAWRFYRERRDLLAKQLCQPVYELWLHNEVSQGRIAAPGFFADDYVRAAWCKATWTGDGPGSIDPQKEVAAAKGRVDLGISTLQAESVLHDGVDWETKNRQRAREIRAQREAGTLQPQPGAGSPPAAPAEDDDEQLPGRPRRPNEDD